MSEENGDEEDNPFADLEEVDADAAGDDVFAEMDASVEAVSESDVLSLLDADDSPQEVDIGEVPDVEVDDEGLVVPKSSYCERCEYFSEPPEVSCSHQGTEIHELPDRTNLLVSNCPIVAERGHVRSVSTDR
jgi:hypothetical protein